MSTEAAVTRFCGATDDKAVVSFVATERGVWASRDTDVARRPDRTLGAGSLRLELFGLAGDVGGANLPRTRRPPASRASAPDPRGDQTYGYT